MQTCEPAFASFRSQWRIEIVSWTIPVWDFFPQMDLNNQKLDLAWKFRALNQFRRQTF